jgi:NDP-sugar pyrophosphorylase family protein
MRALCLALLLAPAAAIARDPSPPAKDGCALDIDGREGVVRTGDVEVRPGDPPRDVVAIDGAVHVRSGATAKDVVAIGGPVVVEKGGTVRGNVSVIGGDVRVAPGARVEGTASAVGGRIDAPAGAVAGKQSNVSIEVDGHPLAARIADEVRASMKRSGCRIRIHESD